MVSWSDLRVPLQRKTSHLSRHRVSIPGARYFVTCCTDERAVGLTGAMLAPQLLAACHAADASGDAALVCATVMPDHLHWIFTLGARLTASQVIAKWKVDTRDELASVGLAWQKNFFEHRVRPEEDIEGYAFYVFMNPYVAGLSAIDAAWPGWHKGAQASFRFEEHLRPGGVPQPEWINDPLARGGGLAVDL